LRFADGPDEVHRNAIAKLEFAEHTDESDDTVEMPIARGG
jgi:acyl-CoA dehydrogenase